MQPTIKLTDDFITRFGFCYSLAQMTATRIWDTTQHQQDTTSITILSPLEAFIKAMSRGSGWQPRNSCTGICSLQSGPLSGAYRPQSWTCWPPQVPGSTPRYGQATPPHVVHLNWLPHRLKRPTRPTASGSGSASGARSGLWFSSAINGMNAPYLWSRWTHDCKRLPKLKTLIKAYLAGHYSTQEEAVTDSHPGNTSIRKGNLKTVSSISSTVYVMSARLTAHLIISKQILQNVSTELCLECCKHSRRHKNHNGKNI